MRVKHKELFDPILRALVLGEFLMSDIGIKITYNQEVLSLYLKNKKISDIQCARDFEGLRQVQSQVYNLINLALYMDQ